MYKYVIKRLLLMIPILLGVILIVFTIMNITPGDPGRQMLGMGASQEAVAARFQEMAGAYAFLLRSRS